MIYSWRILSCPHCKKKYAWAMETLMVFIKIRSGLGPSQVRCAACGGVFSTGLREWPEMNALQKVRYVILSFLYGLFTAILFTPFATLLLRMTGSNATEKFDSPYLINCYIIFTALVLLLQLVRIILSNRRVEEVQPERMIVSFWTWHTNLQFYFIIVGLGSMALYFLIGYLIY
jgi:hypothetical protein